MGTSGTITPDASLGNNFTISPSAAVTMNGPSNPSDGQKITFRITDDATPHLVTFATGSGNFAFGAGITAYAGSTSKVDLVGCIYSAAATRWYIVALVQGY